MGRPALLLPVKHGENYTTHVMFLLLKITSPTTPVLNQHYVALSLLSAKGYRGIYAVISRTIIINFIEKRNGTS
jgi:hypothetical protein